MTSFTFLWFLKLVSSVKYTNPVLNCDCPDPGVLYDSETGLYVAVTTSGDDLNSYPIHISQDLVTWTQKGYVFPQGTQPTWSKSDYWAPEIHYISNVNTYKFKIVVIVFHFNWFKKNFQNFSNFSQNLQQLRIFVYIIFFTCKTYISLQQKLQQVFMV